MIKESIYTLMARVVDLLVAFGAGIIINRHLGPEGRGELAGLIIVFELAIIVFSFGVDISIYHYLDKQKLKYNELNVINTALILFISFGAMAATSVILLFFAFPNTYHAENNLLYLLSLLIFSSVLNKLLYVIQQVKGTVSSLALIQILSSLLYIVFIILLNFDKITLQYIIMAMSVQALVRTIFFLYCLHSIISVNVKLFTMKTASSLLKSGLLVYPAAITTYCYVKFDQLMLLHMGGPEEVGYYSVAVALAMVIMIVPQSVQVVLYNKIMQINREAEAELIQLSAKYTFWLIVIISIIFIILAEQVIYIYGGPEFYPAINLFRILIVGVVFFSVANLLSPIWVKRGYFKMGGMSAVILFVINVGLNYVLIPKYGALGSSVATNITYGAGMVISLMMFYVVTKESPIKIFTLGKKDLVLLRRYILCR